MKQKMTVPVCHLHRILRTKRRNAVVKVIAAVFIYYCRCLEIYVRLASRGRAVENGYLCQVTRLTEGEEFEGHLPTIQ